MLESIKENLSFILISLLIFAALFAIALCCEKALKMKKKTSGARKVAFIAMFGAMAGVLMLFEIPLFFAPGFYKLDLSEIPVMICSFYLGPVAGVVTELLKVVLKLVLKGTSTAFVGDFANFFVGCSFVLPASVIYWTKKTKKRAVWGLAAGTLSMTVIGSLFNAIYLLPRFSALYGIPMDVIVGMGTKVNPAINSVATLLLFAVVPFNLLKGLIVSVVTTLIYKPLSRFLGKKAEK